VFNPRDRAREPGEHPRSKAVGEPPLLTAISIWCAVKHALSFSERDVPRLRLPATGEEILRG
jgi:xanthine dehydrogenase large subunit